MSSQSGLINLSLYEKSFTIGEGGYSFVLGVKNLKTGEIYAAKISKLMVDEENQKSQEFLFIYREINLMSMLNHPSILKFVGFSKYNFLNDPCPTIISEFALNGSLQDMIKSEQLRMAPKLWDITKKFINIYGIAAGMKYLHSHNVIHRDLKPANVLLDQFLYPKISDFGLSKLTDFLSISMNQQSTKDFKGTALYCAPEIFHDKEHSKSSDVYSFGCTVYEIMNVGNPFDSLNYIQIVFKVGSEGLRPRMNDDIPEIYKGLIEKCWQEKEEDRPSFDEIVDELRTNREYFVEGINEGEALDYIDFIDKTPNTFDPINRLILFEDFKQLYGRNKEMRTIRIRQNENETFQTKNLKEKETESLQSKFIDLNQYGKLFMIGEGIYCNVFAVKNLKTGENYAAKISKLMVDEESQKSQAFFFIYREINLMSMLSHPSILKFVGFSKNDFSNHSRPTVISEYAINGSLQNMIEMERLKKSPKLWDITKKFINIYGIAAGMKYLHSHNVIHRDLKPANVLLDQFLHPKIADFGLSKLTDFLSDSLNQKSRKSFKGTALYCAPEIFHDKEHSKSSDVYSFGCTVYEIMNVGNSFDSLNYFQIVYKIISQKSRPKMNDDIPEIYKGLIEKCWQEKEEDRPSFDEIVDELRTNREYFVEGINEGEALDYIDFIDKTPNTFDPINRLILFEDFKQLYGRNKEIQTININRDENNDDARITRYKEKKNEESNNSDDNDDNEGDDDDDSSVEEEKNQNETLSDDLNDNPINENQPLNMIIPFDSFKKLDKECQKLVKEAQTDPAKQFIVGRSFVEGINNFPTNVELGFKYIKESNRNRCSDSLSYYAHHLIKGKLIKQDLKEAEKLIKEIEDDRVFSLKGELSKKMNKIKEARKYFEEGSNNGDIECMYKYGKMLFLGEGIKKNDKKAFKYLTISKEKGHKKSEFFLNATNIMNIKGFSSIPIETQYFFISRIVNILRNSPEEQVDLDSKEILIKSNETEKFFYNKSLKSTNFYKCLSLFKTIYIEIDYKSNIFKLISDLAIKIQKKRIKDVKIGIVFPSLKSSPIPKDSECFSTDFSYHKIGDSVNSIKSKAFKGCSLLKHIIISSFVRSISDHAFNGCSSLSIVKFKLPSSLSSIGERAFKGCSSLNRVCLPGSVTTIEDFAFHGCSSLTEITIPNSVKKIGYRAFFECTELSEISILSSAISIEREAFSGYNKSSRKMTIHTSEIKLVENIFVGFTEIEMKGEIKRIPNKLFQRCKALQMMKIPESVTMIEESAFNYCESMKEIEIPNSIKKIEERTFSWCYSLKRIKIPNSVTMIGGHAFKGCTSLTELIIPSSVTKIGDNAFEGCFSLKKIELPNSLNLIEDYVFKGCSSLTELIIPSSVTKIGDYSFGGCSSLKEIIIPDSVTEIGDYSFEGCISLTQITIPKSVIEIGSNVFNQCSSLRKISLNTKAINKGTFYGCSSLRKITLKSLDEFKIKIISDNSQYLNELFEKHSKLSRLTVFIFSFRLIDENLINKCLSVMQTTTNSQITSIVENAFYGCESLAKIIIPSSVTLIGNNAFYGCESLVEIIIPSSVTSIGNNAFDGCESLTEIKIHNSIVYIGSNAFDGCTSLAQFNIPSSVTKIEKYTFHNCSSLSKIIIPVSLISIGLGAFCGCKSLTQISIPPSVAKIEDDTFHYCLLLNKVKIPSSVTSIGNDSFRKCQSLTKIAIPNSTVSIGNFSFEGCSSLKEITIPNSVIQIGYNSFQGCSSLTEITIPNSVNGIGENAFQNCTSLAQVSILSSTLTTIQKCIFNECSSLVQMSIPSSVTSIEKNAFGGCTSLTSIEMPPSVKSIGENAFNGCTSLVEITIPSSVISIESNAFAGCILLLNVHFSSPSSLKRIGNYAFSECLSLREISVPSNVTFIGDNVFRSCSLMARVTIPSSVTTAGNYVFKGCSSLLQITIPSSFSFIGESFFRDCCSLTRILIPSSVTRIGCSSFRSCSSLEQISIPSSVTLIEDFTFEGCSALKQIDIPNSVTKIGCNSFKDCSSLLQVDIPSSVTEIGCSSFKNCSSLLEVNIPSSINSIEELTFESCSSLKKVKISSSVTKIGYRAFRNCSSLEKVKIPSSVNSIGDFAFEGCVILKKIKIPESVKIMGEDVFRRCISLVEISIPPFIDESKLGL